MPSAFKSPLRNEISGLQKENGTAIGEKQAAFSYDEDVFARLKVAQDSLIEDLECKIVVSSVVGQAVLRGVVKALSEESQERLSEKDAEIDRLHTLVSENASEIDRLQRVVAENARQLNTIASESFERLKQSELCMLEKERELAKMAENLVDLTFRLQAESLNNVGLEKKIKEVEARDSAKQKRMSDMTEEMENIRREQSSEIEMLKREIRLKDVRHREQVEELSAENETQVAELIEAQRESMQAMETLRFALEEQNMLHEQEIDVLVSVYRGKMEELKGLLVHQVEYSEDVGHHVKDVEFEDGFPKDEDRGGIENQNGGGKVGDVNNVMWEQEMAYKTEIDLLSTYYDCSLESLQQVLREEKIKCITNTRSPVVDDIVGSELLELEVGVLFDCLVGFFEDVKQALHCLDLERVQMVQFGNLFSKGPLELRKTASYRSRGKHSAVSVQERLLEQHHQHQVEMDVLLEFFLGKLNELYNIVIERSGTGTQHEDVKLAELERENASLRRELEQVLVEKTEEMFRLKRDYFKELDKLKLEGGQYEFGILKRQFADSRQKLDRILKHGDGQRSDSDSSSSSEPDANHLGRFTEDFPLLVSELQYDIEQLILDTGMAKPEDSGNKSRSDLLQDFEALNTEYESALKSLEDEKRQNLALTVELQELEHNINLSNGELERLLRLLEMEKQARLQKECELQNVKQDVNLIRRQLEIFQGQLEAERLQKKRMEGDMKNLQSQVELSNHRIEALQKELHDVIRVKNAISEDYKKAGCILRQVIADVGKEVKKAVEKQSAAMSDVSMQVRHLLDEKDARMIKMNKRMKCLCTCAKRQLSTYHTNLAMAEEEVDMLGDENDYLVNLLERVYLALAPVFQHYPGIAELMKLIRGELVSRIEQPV